jgi:D-aminoacyl-tRNA deacylase
VAADWGLEEWDEPAPSVLEQVFERSGAEIGLLVGDRPGIEAHLETTGYRLVDETWLRATSGVALDLVAACAERLCTVEDGLRFGYPARNRSRRSIERLPGAARVAGAARTHDVGLPEEATVTRLPTDLLEEAAGIDLDRTLGAVSEVAIAYRTTEAGTRPAPAVLLEAPDTRPSLIDGLAAVLESKYDRVERTTEAVTAERTVFDPERAATLGVPEGPAFGRLAAGESVTVDGREIDPAVVSATERRRFPL